MLCKKPWIVPIPGTRKVERVQENAGSAEVVLSAEEVEEIVKGIVAETGATSIKEMGMVMKSAKEKIGAAADGKMISEVVKKILA